MPPDAADAAVLADAAPPSACFAACAALGRFCGDSAKTCPWAMAEAERDRLIRSPSGAALTCACVASARSKADVEACGLGCTGSP